MKLKNIIMILLFISTFVNQLHAQDIERENFLFYGTIIVAAICEDGILFASDSRSSFILNKENSNKVYAYFENDKKIFEIGNYLIASSGISMLNNKFFRDIVGEYNIAYPQKEDIETTFNNFLDYLKTEQNVHDSVLEENDIIIAGYENSKPKIIAQSKERRLSQVNVAHMIHSDTELPRFVRFSQSIKLTCRNLAPAMEKAIYALAEYRNDNKFGGPLEFMQITTSNKHVTIKTFDANNFKTYKDLANAILDGKIEVKYVFPFSEELLKQTLKEGIEKIK